MEELKWYKSTKKVKDFLTFELVNAVMEYYTKEKPNDQTKLYQALGYYYIKTTNPDGVFKYFTNVEFKESDKPARKNLSIL
jgi:hypothetical protein